MIQFRIKAREFKPYFKVIVYDNLKEMRKAADKFCKKTGAEHEDNSKILGVCHCFIRVAIGSDGSEKTNNFAGIIRLTKNYLGTEIVSHELIHAGLWIYRLELGTEDPNDGSISNANFKDGCNEQEEDFAHIYGRLFGNFVSKMYKYNLY